MSLMHASHIYLSNLLLCCRFGKFGPDFLIFLVRLHLLLRSMYIALVVAVFVPRLVETLGLLAGGGLLDSPEHSIAYLSLSAPLLFISPPHSIS